MTDITYHGSCLCGGCRFQLVGEPEAVFWCYCQHCAKNAGGPGQISAKFNEAQLTVVSGIDTAKTYILKDTTSGVEKHKVFCDSCGCTLWTIPMKHHGEKLMVRTSLIKDGLQTLQPKAEFFASCKPHFSSEMKAFDTMPGH